MLRCRGIATCRGIAMVVVSGYWYMGVCACVLISRVRQVQDKSVFVRSEEEKYVHVLLRLTKMTARFVPNLEDSPLQKLHPEVKIVCLSS